MAGCGGGGGGDGGGGGGGGIGDRQSAKQPNKLLPSFKNKYKINNRLHS